MKEKQINSPYHRVAPSLLKKGLIVVPLKNKSKTPLIPQWTKITQQDSEKYLNSSVPYNIGLLLGKPTGIIALDFDSNKDRLHQKILKICGQSDVVKKGARGGTIFFRYNGENPKKWQKDGEMVLELLSTGNQTVIPPSIHPDTNKPYIYTKGRTLSDIDVSALPYLPEDFIERIDKLFNPAKKNSLFGDSDLNSIKEALYFIEPNDYDTWLKCGMGLKNEFGDEGFEVWEKWSLASPKCKAEELFPKWKSFKKDGITSATIFQMAIKNGYVVPKGSASFYNVGNARTEFDRWRLKGRPVGLSTGIEPFDNLLHIRKKEFTLITGTPNSGKSEFLDFLVYSIVKNHNLNVMFASFEKEPTDHVESFVHRFTGKALEKRTTDEEKVALSCIKDSIFFYNHLYESRDIDDILKRAQALVDNVGLDILVIDPFSYISSRDIANEFAHVRYVCIQLTKFAKKNKLHVILVAHPKALESRKPSGKENRLTLYSVSGGANFYNKCDNGIIIRRGEDNTIEIDIQKVRQQAIDTTGTFLMEYDGLSRGFVNYKGDF